MKIKVSLLSVVAGVVLTVMVLAGAFGVRAGPLGAVHAVVLTIDDWLYDAFLTRLPVRPATGRVVLVAADERSLNDGRLGQWPWAPTTHADLLDRLGDAGAAAVVMDLGFAGTGAPGQEAHLAACLRNSGAAALGVFTMFDAAAGRIAYQLPPPVLMQAARAVGYNEMDAETARAVRVTDRDPTLASLNPLLVDGLLIEQGLNPTVVVRKPARARVLTVGRWRLPLRDGAVPVNYRVGALPTISYVDALTRPLASLKGKIVVVASTFDPRDVYPVPCTAAGAGGELPGGVILATALDMILAGDTIRTLPAGTTWLAVFLLEALVTGICLYFRKPALTWTLVFTTPLLMLYGAWLAFRFAHLYVAVLAPLLTAKVTFSLMTISNLSHFNRSLARFVPRRVTEEIARHGTLADRETFATILFQDIQGYTSISENLRPGQVRELLNAFYGRQQDIIHRHRGTIMDYQGDAQMVMFGGDGKMDHAQQAVDAAWEILQAFESWAPHGGNGQEIRFGIGIASGLVSVGKLGGDYLQFSALGDTTNTAARLQGLTRQLQCPVVLSQATWAFVKDRCDAEEVADVRLKGKEMPVTVYKLVEVRSLRS